WTLGEDGVRCWPKLAPYPDRLQPAGPRQFGFYEVFQEQHVRQHAWVRRTPSCTVAPRLYLRRQQPAPSFFADMLASPMEPPRCASRPRAGTPKTLRGAFPKHAGRPRRHGPFIRPARRCGVVSPAFERTVEALTQVRCGPSRETSAQSRSLTVTFVAATINRCRVCSAPSVHHPPTPWCPAQPADARGWIWLGVAKALAGKGLGRRIIMIGTLTALQWFIYDTVKVVLRLPRPPPPTMPESLRLKLEAKQAS
uniref:Phosphate carrier protein, mitochondrial n=1 Tax=Macrostomum lignano TaxID=282301 RepID=A0A1I8F335_9PLAT